MYIMISLIIICIVCIISRTKFIHSFDSAIFLELGVGFSGIFLIIMLIIMLISNYGVQDTLNKMQVTRTEIETSNNKYIAIKKIEYNQEVISNRYWNSTQWDWFIPDTLANLKTIK